MRRKERQTLIQTDYCDLKSCFKFREEKDWIWIERRCTLNHSSTIFFVLMFWTDPGNGKWPTELTTATS